MTVLSLVGALAGPGMSSVVPGPVTLSPRSMAERMPATSLIAEAAWDTTTAGIGPSPGARTFSEPDVEYGALSPG